MAEHNELVPQTVGQKDPYRATASEFTVGNPSSMSAGTAEGKNQLATQSGNQCSPRNAQDDGPGSSGYGTPSNWGKNDFKVGKNSGEGASSPSSVGGRESVNLATGRVEVSGYKSSRQKEVADPNVKMPA